MASASTCNLRKSIFSDWPLRREVAVVDRLAWPDGRYSHSHLRRRTRQRIVGLRRRMYVGPTRNREVSQGRLYQKNMKNHHGGVIKVGDYLYGYSDGMGWVCQNFMDGSVKWRERDALEKGAVTCAGGMLYCIGEKEGQVVLAKASPEGWKESGRFKLEPQTKIRSDRGAIWTHPVVLNGKLYLRDQDLVYCYDVRAGSSVASIKGVTPASNSVGIGRQL